MKAVPTADREMIDVMVRQPVNGTDVLALTHGGITVRTKWNSTSHQFFDAWEPHGKVPASVKTRQLERYKS